MKKAKTLFLYIRKNEIKNCVAVFSDVEYRIDENMNYLYLFKNKEYIGVFNLNYLIMEVEE